MLAIIRKDLQIEFRTKETLASLLLLGLLTLLILSFAFDPTSELRVEAAPVDRGTIYFGKTLGNFLFMMVAQLVIAPVFVFFFNLPLSLALAEVLLSVGLGLLGFAAVGRLFAAVAVRTRAREIMLPLLLLPLVVPIFIAGVKSTAQLLAGK